MNLVRIGIAQWIEWVGIICVFASANVLIAEDSTSDQTIRALLQQQTDCWNNKDIEGFMQTYWKSDKLTFSGGGQTTRGWQATLDRYKSKYPPEKMGTLTFDALEVEILVDSVALVLGNWHLSNADTKADGNFSLVLRKIEGKWKIVHDHSSTLQQPKPGKIQNDATGSN